MGHPGLFEYPTGSGIPQHVHGGDPVQAQGIESVGQHEADGLRAIATVPVGLPDPVPKLGMTVRTVDVESYGADELSIDALGYGEPDVLTLLETSLMAADPVLRHPILVGMRDAKRGGRDGAVAGEPLDDRGIR